MHPIICLQQWNYCRVIKYPSHCAHIYTMFVNIKQMPVAFSATICQLNRTCFTLVWQAIKWECQSKGHNIQCVSYRTRSSCQPLLSMTQKLQRRSRNNPSAANSLGKRESACMTQKPLHGSADSTLLFNRQRLQTENKSSINWNLCCKLAQVLHNKVVLIAKG